MIANVPGSRAVLAAAAILILLLAGPASAGEDARTLLSRSESLHRTNSQEYSGGLAIFF